MKREIIISGDGSQTIFVESLGEHYHSSFGAKAESLHIFIRYGLLGLDKAEIHILEAGMGTGLNVFLSMLNRQQSQRIKYYTIEKYPLEPIEYNRLCYSEKAEEHALFKKIHEVDWEEWKEISDGFHLYKHMGDLKGMEFPGGQDLVYFDAFAPEVQPDLWSEEIFGKLYESLNPEGRLLTYSVKGEIRRKLKACGFECEKLPGPKGKRHILRAYK